MITQPALSRYRRRGDQILSKLSNLFTNRNLFFSKCSTLIISSNHSLADSVSVIFQNLSIRFFVTISPQDSNCCWDFLSDMILSEIPNITRSGSSSNTLCKIPDRVLNTSFIRLTENKEYNYAREWLHKSDIWHKMGRHLEKVYVILF